MENNFSELVKKHMEEKDISLRGLARKMKVQASFLSRMLNGHTKNLPSDKVLGQMAEILKIDPPIQLFIAAGRMPSGNKKINNSISEILLKLGENKLNKFAQMMQKKSFADKVFGMINPPKGKK